MAPPASAPMTTLAMSSGSPPTENGTLPSTSQPTGNITSPAMIARPAANTTFSAATQFAGSGASRRSSISLVKEKSMTSGNATLWMAVSMMVIATMPGNNCWRTRDW